MLKPMGLQRIGHDFAAEQDFPGGSDDKASAYNVGNLGSIPGWGRSPGEGTATHSSILPWKIPWTEKSGRLQSIGSQSWTQLSDLTSLAAEQQNIRYSS